MAQGQRCPPPSNKILQPSTVLHRGWDSIKGYKASLSFQIPLKWTETVPQISLIGITEITGSRDKQPTWDPTGDRCQLLWHHKATRTGSTGCSSAAWTQLCGHTTLKVIPANRWISPECRVLQIQARAPAAPLPAAPHVPGRFPPWRPHQALGAPGCQRLCAVPPPLSLMEQGWGGTIPLCNINTCNF